MSPSSSPRAPSATLVNQPGASTAINERPSVKLKIVGGKSNIVNSVVVSADRQTLYLISSNSKRTTVVACENNVEVAIVEWDRSSPRMVFRQKKMKCKEWLARAGPETEYWRTCHLDSIAVILIFLVLTPPGLACSRTVTHNLFG